MFRNINTTIEQRSDPDLDWIIKLLNQHETKPNVSNELSIERKQLLSQFHNFKINDDKLWRLHVDSNEEKAYQYVAPKSQRVEIMRYLHCSVLGSHLMYDKIVTNLTDHFIGQRYETTYENL